MTPDTTQQLQEFSKIKITGSGDPARPLLFMRDLMSQKRTEIYTIASAIKDKKISLTLTPEFASQPFLEVEFSDFCSCARDRVAASLWLSSMFQSLPVTCPVSIGDGRYGIGSVSISAYNTEAQAMTLYSAEYERVQRQFNKSPEGIALAARETEKQQLKDDDSRLAEEIINCTNLRLKYPQAKQEIVDKINTLRSPVEKFMCEDALRLAERHGKLIQHAIEVNGILDSTVLRKEILRTGGLADVGIGANGAISGRADRYLKRMSYYGDAIYTLMNDKDAVVTINSAVGVFPSEGNRNDNWFARKIAAFLPGFRH